MHGLIAWAACLVLDALSGQAAAQSPAKLAPEQFYKDRTVKIMVGHGPGGSYDFYARLAADMLKKHLPSSSLTGNTVIVENKPGGGGVVAMSHFYAQGARDGTQLAVFPETSAHTQILDPAIGRWKMEQMAYIGSFAPSNSVIVRRRDAPVKTTAEMQTTTATVGCSGVTSQSFQYPAMLKVLAGYKFRMVCGYPGSAEYLSARPRCISSRQSGGAGSRFNNCVRLPPMDLIGARELFNSWPSTRSNRCQACRSSLRKAWLRSASTSN